MNYLIKSSFTLHDPWGSHYFWPCLQMRKLNPKESNLLIGESHLSPEATIFTVCVEDPDVIFTRCQSKSVQSLFGESDYSPLVWGKSLVVYSKQPIVDTTLSTYGLVIIWTVPLWGGGEGSNGRAVCLLWKRVGSAGIGVASRHFTSKENYSSLIFFN